MNDLAEFLIARIGEDEAVAIAAGGGHLSAYLEGGDDGWAVESAPYLEVDGMPVEAILGGKPLAKLLERFDPARVLTECEAKRRIVELHRGQKALWDDDENPLEVVECPECGVLFPCPTLRLLALPYADHPDYRQEWRP